MQEDIEQRTMSVTVQAAKLSGRVLKAAIAAALQKMEHSRNTPKVGRNSMKRLTARDPGASTIEVTGRIRSFERIAKKHEVRYHIEKDPGTDPPKWTVYFKANQADALTAAFKEYTRKDLARSTRPSLLSQLAKFKELAQALGRDKVKNKKYGIVYADPPWRYDMKRGKGVAENHYPTMSMDEICALPVADLAAKDSALFLWATFPQLNEAFRVIEAWGFHYKTLAFLWLKQNRKADSWFYGMGFWTRSNAEVCLLATRGHPKRQCAGIHLSNDWR